MALTRTRLFYRKDLFSFDPVVFATYLLISGLNDLFFSTLAVLTNSLLLKNICLNNIVIVLSDMGVPVYWSIIECLTSIGMRYYLVVFCVFCLN